MKVLPGVFDYIIRRALTFDKEVIFCFMTQTQDERVIELLFQRDESGLDQISSSYGRLYQSIARRLLFSAEEAEECVNDVLLDIWNSIPPRKPQSLEAYGCMLARRRSIDRIRFLTAEKRGSGAYTLALDELEECVGDCGIDDSGAQLREALNEFIGKLPPRKRRIFVGRYFAFDSVETLAERNQISVNAVGIQLSRMRRQLKKFLAERRIFV